VKIAGGDEPAKRARIRLLGGSVVEPVMELAGANGELEAPRRKQDGGNDEREHERRHSDPAQQLQALVFDGGRREEGRHDCVGRQERAGALSDPGDERLLICERGPPSLIGDLLEGGHVATVRSGADGDVNVERPRSRARPCPLSPAIRGRRATPHADTPVHHKHGRRARLLGERLATGGWVSGCVARRTAVGGSGVSQARVPAPVPDLAQRDSGRISPRRLICGHATRTGAYPLRPSMPAEPPRNLPPGEYLVVGGYRARWKASFRVSGDRIDPDAITRATGLTPTMSHKQGEVMPSGDRVWRQGLWSLNTEDVVFDGETELEDHLVWLLDRLEPQADHLRQLMAEHGLKADFFCGCFMEGFQAGLELSGETLLRVGRLQASTGLDIYAPDGVEPAVQVVPKAQEARPVEAE